jgi:hypothetical protein
VSNPLSGTFDAETFFDLVLDVLSIAWARDASVAPDGEWLSFDPTAPPALNTLEQIDETMGLLLFVEEQITFVLPGDVPETTSIAVYGNRWNLIGYPSFEEKTVPDFLTGIEYTIICAYDSENQSDPWECFDPNVPEILNDLQEIDGRNGYLLLPTADGTITVEN